MSKGKENIHYLSGLAPINTYSMLQSINHIFDSQKDWVNVFPYVHGKDYQTIRKSCLFFSFAEFCFELF